MLIKNFGKLFFCFVFLFLSCGMPTGEGDYEDPYSPTSNRNRDRKTDRRGNLDDDNRRDSEIRRLKDRDTIIQADLDHRYDGGYYYEGYGGAECGDSDSCIAICEYKIPRRNQSRCERSPRALVEALEDGFLALLNISEVDSVDINPGLIAGMLDINVDLIVDLVEDQMSEGDLKSFLAWVAVNDDIAEVFLREDRRTEIMEKAFDELGELQTDARREKETGLNVGLIQNEDTFFHLAALEGNEAAFEIAYDVLESVCNSKSCKMDLLCARENQTRNRSRIFGYESSILDCRTSASQGRRSRQETTCYIHGATSWSFLNELIEEDEIRDNDFEGEENQITVESCNEYCGERDSDKCKKLR